jgi:hypothetical protein
MGLDGMTAWPRDLCSAFPGVDPCDAPPPSGLADAAAAFAKLGLKPELVAKAVPVLISFVTKSGGANLGSLLGSVLK